MTCDVTRGRYLLMIIDYSILLVSIVMVDYSGTFLFSFFLFFFSFVGSVAHMPRASKSIKSKVLMQRNLVKTFGRLNSLCEDDFRCN